jgi:hypothetical protein
VASAAAPRGAVRLAVVRRSARGGARFALSGRRPPSAAPARAESPRLVVAPAPSSSQWRAVGGGLLVTVALGAIVVAAALASLALAFSVN